MSGMMLHGLGDCTPELNCGCMAKAPSDPLRERIAQALWRSRRLHGDPSIRPYVACLVDADAVIAALRLREIVDGEGRYWQTPWERIEEDE